PCGRGGVATMLEPGEGVFLRQLQAINAANPRFGFAGIVPGSGSGDWVPMTLPQGSFVLNRRAMATFPTVSAGGATTPRFQSGGMAPQAQAQNVRQEPPRPAQVHFQVRSKADIRELKQALSELVRDHIDARTFLRPR
nr:hypothetical protein [Candidatus Tectomicrobia bacterium]